MHSDPSTRRTGELKVAPAFPMAGVAPAAIDVVIASGRSGRTRRRLGNIAEAAALAVLVPAGVFIVAVPILLLWWVFTAASAWLAGTG